MSAMRTLEPHLPTPDRICQVQVGIFFEMGRQIRKKSDLATTNSTCHHAAKFQFHDEGPDLKNEYCVEESGKPFAYPGQVAAEISAPYITFQGRPSSTITSRSNSCISSSADTARERTNSEISKAATSPAYRAEFPSPLSPSKRPLPNDFTIRPQVDLRLPPIRTLNSTLPLPHPDMRHRYTVYKQPERDISSLHGPDMHGNHDPVPRQIYAEYRRLEDSQAAAVPDEDLLSPEQWQGLFRWPNDQTTKLCTCLMHYFREELAPWFDVGDPSRTFETIVPHEACFHPPLLNAVFVAASRHLLASKKHKASDGRTVQYQNERLDRLNDDMCYRYLDAVIAYLKRATNAAQLCDVEYFAAAVLLRFASDFQRSITGEEEDGVNRTYQSFIRARAFAMADVSASPPNQHNWMQSSHSPHNNQASFQLMQEDNRAWGKKTLLSFEHACNRVALRQEILATIMYISRPKEGRAAINAKFTLPPTWNALRLFPAQEKSKTSSGPTSTSVTWQMCFASMTTKVHHPEAMTFALFANTKSTGSHTSHIRSHPIAINRNRIHRFRIEPMRPLLYRPLGCWAKSTS
ncbi:uncharacterized protein AB675_5903 [Cyphellophora attinorum]|uniref:Uncharacterized protein n=1 Tax=Cyphellophora attinorum TaxID=1664694 RepID=A0A0N0NLC3_9EURO|nr:uncharacterized protein AB675_5903 [Phialophora attinorum]KPI38879.1 hypothetical protein AB675_5903 [Phialophora attinorum]